MADLNPALNEVCANQGCLPRAFSRTLVFQNKYCVLAVRQRAGDIIAWGLEASEEQTVTEFDSQDMNALSRTYSPAVFCNAFVCRKQPDRSSRTPS